MLLFTYLTQFLLSVLQLPAAVYSLRDARSGFLRVSLLTLTLVLLQFYSSEFTIFDEPQMLHLVKCGVLSIILDLCHQNS